MKERRVVGVHSLFGSAVAGTDDVAHLNEKCIWNLRGHHSRTFGLLFSYQMMRREKKRKTRECVVGETWALTQLLSNPIATLACRNVNVMRICSFLIFEVPTLHFRSRSSNTQAALLQTVWTV